MGVLARPPSLMGAPIPHLLGLWPTKTHTALFSRKLLFVPLWELHRGSNAVHSGGSPQTMTDTGVSALASTWAQLGGDVHTPELFEGSG